MDELENVIPFGDSGDVEKEFNEKIAANIRRERKRVGLTQVQLGSRIGVSGTMISQYESNAPSSRRPKWETLERIATALGISIARLIYSEPETAYWTKRFREGLNEALACLDRTDCVDAGFDLDYALSVAAGEVGFSFEDACKLCDTLGTSLDEVLHWKEAE